jgi:hypothetical protein
MKNSEDVRPMHPGYTSGINNDRKVHLKSSVTHVLHAHPKKWQNNQRIDGGHILVEVEASIVSTVL